MEAEGIGIILWKKVLQWMKILKEGDQWMAFQIIWGTLVDDMEVFATNCLKISPEMTTAQSNRLCKIIEKTYSKVLDNLPRKEDDDKELEGQCIITSPSLK